MRSAISLKYCGLSVNALDANYSSYNHLGLICQCCSEPVFLVNSRTVGNTKRKLKTGRVIEVGEYETEPYFAHFTSAEKECQVRGNLSKSQVDREREKSHYQSKNQRLKHFQAKIKQILSLNPRTKNAGLFDSLWFRTYYRSGQKTTTNSYLRQAIASMRSQLHELRSKTTAILDRVSKLDNLNKRLPEVEYLNNKLELKLHFQVVDEAISYLFSPAGYQVLAWLYRVAATETLMTEAIIDDLRHTEGDKSAQFNHVLIHGSYILTFKGIFGFLDYNLIEPNKLEKIVNNLKFRQSEPELLLYSLGGLIALTPWRQGFNDNPIEPKINISHFYVASKSKVNKLGGYFLLNSAKSKLILQQKRPLDLSSWIDESVRHIKTAKNYQTASAYIKRNLPDPFGHLELEANIPSWEFKESARFKLFKNTSCLVSIEFWFVLKNKREIDKLKRRNKEIHAQELELLSSHPTATIYSSEDIKYEHIMLAIINGLLIALAKSKNYI